MAEIIDEGRKLAAEGVYGFDILAFRHVEDPEKLAKEFVGAMEVPVVIAGSINSRERMKFVEDIGAYGFTMGSALFEKDFVSDGSFRDNLAAVCAMMDSIR